MVSKDLKHLSADGGKRRRKRSSAGGGTKGGDRAQRHLPWGAMALLAASAGGIYLLYLLFTSGAVEQRIEEVRQKSAQAGPPELMPAPEQGPPQLPRGGEEGRRFDFYDRLPEQEVVIPESEILALQEQARGRADTVYYLQAGSFRRRDDAEALKARLAFLGVESRVQRVMGRGEVPWFRVRVGPFESSRELNRIRNRIHGADIETMVIRLRKEAADAP